MGRWMVPSTGGLAVIALVSGFGVGMSVIGISAIVLGLDAVAATGLASPLPLLAAFVVWAITSELTFVIGFRSLLRR